ncbi:MAG: carboxypeptidase-like regulatory domain-containing protein [Bacteroidota bacterium]
MLNSTMQYISISRLFLLIFLYAGLRGKAQDSLLNVSGKIIDLNTKKPIDFAIITDFKTNTSVQSDAKGNFEKAYKSKDLLLIISKLGYESQKVKINASTKFPLAISLAPRSLDLSEVVIAADKPVKRLVDNTFYILDYQFLDNNILLLGEMDTKHIAKLINLDGKELCRLPLKNIQYESLFKDCFGNVHLLNKFHTNQVYIQNNTVNLLYNVKRSTFDSLMIPCILHTEENIYFEVTFNKKQTKSLYVFNKNTKQKSGLGIFSDEFMISMQNDEENFMNMKYGAVDTENTMGDASANDLRAARRKEDDITFARRIIYTAAYIPVFMNNDTLTVFNHPNSLIHRYSLNNKEVDLQVMEYNNYKNWKPQVVSDEISHKFYTTYLHDGIITLGEINLQTGKIEKRFKLTHTFPKNIKVRNGIVYYLYRLKDSEDKMAIYAHEIR